MFIDIQHNPQVLLFIVGELEEIDGWHIDNNANMSNYHWEKLPNKTASIFQINTRTHLFSWWGTTNPSDTVYCIDSIKLARAMLECLGLYSYA
jgi:hypothetical protein